MLLLMQVVSITADRRNAVLCFIVWPSSRVASYLVRQPSLDPFVSENGGKRHSCTLSHLSYTQRGGRFPKKRA